MKVETALLILVAVGVVPMGVSAQSVGASGDALAVSWPDSDWNPHKNNDDVKVSLPCGGAMAFRPVTTSESRNPRDLDLLDDRRVVLGDAEREENPVATYIRTDYLAGTFRRRDGVQYYLIGKYEVTDRQYAAVMAEAGQCPPPGEGPALPKTDVGWYDAVDFTRRLNRWLYATPSATKPWTDKQFGFVRLPTDAEWEFAARGGLAVSDADRARPTPVPISLLSEYAWFKSGVASGGAKQKIGRLKPNPLLLYDMLGNVEEIVADPFRMVRAGRMHGQAGAVIYRGGSYLTPGESLRSSNRTEMRLYGEAGREVKFPFVGFRLAIGAVATGDLGSAAELRKALERSMQIGNAEGGETIAEKLQQMTSETSEPDRQRIIRDALATMTELSESLKKKAKGVNDLEEVVDRQTTAAVQALIEHALISKAVIASSARQLDDWQKHVDDASSERRQRELATVSLEAERQQFVLLIKAYTLLLENFASYPAERVDGVIASSRRIHEEIGTRATKARAVELASIGSLLKKFRQQAGRMSDKDISRALVGDRKWMPR